MVEPRRNRTAGDSHLHAQQRGNISEPTDKTLLLIVKIVLVVVILLLLPQLVTGLQY